MHMAEDKLCQQPHLRPQNNLDNLDVFKSSDVDFFVASKNETHGVQ